MTGDLYILAALLLGAYMPRVAFFMLGIGMAIFVDSEVAESLIGGLLK